MVSTLVIGGTGAVGRHLAPILASQGQAVLVASRNLRGAVDVADQVEGATPIVMDTHAKDLVLPENVELVIDCSGTDQTTVASATARAGADLIDISASTTHIERVAELQSLFAELGQRCLIGVGLAPGLSTMLAASIHDPDHPLPISIHGILDTRDEHGPGSADFTLSKVGTDFADPATGRRIRNFGNLQRPALPAGFGRRLVAQADFPDQHILTNELAVPVVTTYGFTSTATTLLFAAASRLPGGPSALTRVSNSLPRPTGSGPWLITAVTAAATAWATGVGQAKGTAVLASLAAAHLATVDTIEPGITYLHKTLVLDPETLAALSAHGIAVATDRTD